MCVYICIPFSDTPTFNGADSMLSESPLLTFQC